MALQVIFVFNSKCFQMVFVIKVYLLPKVVSNSNVFTVNIVMLLKYSAGDM